MNHPASTSGSDKRRPVTGVVAAAGKGTRLGAKVPKAFVPLNGKTLLERSVRGMVTSGVVDDILVTVSDQMLAYAGDLARGCGLFGLGVPVRFVVGGAERADSVWRALEAIGHTHGVVLIHDAARALTPPGMIARVARAVLEGAPAVIPVVPVADTIKEVDGRTVTGTPVRANLRAVQTPQGFDLATLRQANADYFASETPFEATDDASLMEWHGHTVTTVNGDPMAMKVTTPMDFLLACQLTEQAEKTVFEVPGD